MDVTAIIPARGGSKGIARKNLQQIGGLPLVCRTVQAAMNSSRVNRVVVSTDDDEIASVSSRCGADVVYRPAAISDDTASSESAVLHALESLEEQDRHPDCVAFLQCTSPFTTGSQIDKVIAALDESYWNSSMSVAPWHGFLWDLDGNGLNHDPFRHRVRRQDLPQQYIETGAIYAMRSLEFKITKNRFCPPLKPVIVEGPTLEIDTLMDLQICRGVSAGMFNTLQ